MIKYNLKVNDENNLTADGVFNKVKIGGYTCGCN
jgi:hypothetical protein